MSLGPFLSFAIPLSLSPETRHPCTNLCLGNCIGNLIGWKLRQVMASPELIRHQTGSDAALAVFVEFR